MTDRSSTDCCIIGGGIIGLSIARELAGRGHSVRVLARHERRDTASWAAAGILPPAPTWPGMPPADALTAWSDRLLREWTVELCDETGIDNGLRRCGGLHVVGPGGAGGQVEDLHARAAMWRDRGTAVELLDAAGVADCDAALAGAVARGVITAGLHLPEETQIRPPRHLEALERSCRGRGVVFTSGVELAAVAGVPAGGLTRYGRAIDGLVVNRAGVSETVRAAHYVLAAGPWSEGLGRLFGVEITTRPIRGQIALVRLSGPRLSRVVNRGLEYLVPREDGRLLIGSTLEDAGFDHRTTPDAIASLVAFGGEMLGEIGCTAIERSWAGLRPGSADGLPTIGPIPGCDNASVATGHYRAGLHQSTGTAMLVADLIEGRASHLPLDPFRAGR